MGMAAKTVGVVAGVLVGVSMGLGGVHGMAAPKAKAHSVTIPQCKEEDSHNCIWIADKRGNKKGTSFIDYKGHVYYIDRSMDY